MSAQQYLDFDIEIGNGDGRTYPVVVLFSPGGNARGALQWAFGERELDNYMLGLENALLRSGTTQRRVLSPQEQTVQEFGLRLFTTLFTGDVRSCYDVSRQRAHDQSKGLRIRLRILPPELASLPWEFLYDDRHGEYLCLSSDTPIVRYLELTQPLAPLATAAPLRVLGMVASPNNLEPLNVEREKANVIAALQPLESSGLVELHWVAGQTTDALSEALDNGPWHIFHFIGHGGFDANRDEGYLALCDADGDTRRLGATALARLLGDHRSLRLVLLNSCDGARASKRDIFSSTTTTLLRRGRNLAAVLAMQHSISDHAAAKFATVFYRSVANGRPVDDAVTRARKAMSIDRDSSVEWGTPVLYMRAADGVLFDLAAHMQTGQQVHEQIERERAEHQAEEQTERERSEHETRDQVERERVEHEVQEQAERELVTRIEAKIKQRNTQLADLSTQFEKLKSNNDHDKMIEIGERILQLNQKSSIRTELAQCYDKRSVYHHKQGEYDHAIACNTRAIKLSPQTANHYWSRGLSYYAKGEYDRAIDDYTHAIELDPQVESYYNSRGNSYHAKSEYDYAIADYTEAIKLNPQKVFYLTNRGYSYYRKGEYDASIVDYTRAIELSPQIEDYYNLRGNSYHAKGEYDYAIADYTEAIELNPQNVVYFSNRGNSYHTKGEYDQAIMDFDYAVTLSPQTAAYYKARGLSYYSKGEYHMALRDETRAIELDIDNAEYRYSRGLTYRANGDYEGSRRDFDLAAKMGYVAAKEELKVLPKFNFLERLRNALGL